MLLRSPDQATCTTPLVIEAAGPRYRHKTQFLYPGDLIGAYDASADIMPEIPFDLWHNIGAGGSDSHRYMLQSIEAVRLA